LCREFLRSSIVEGSKWIRGLKLTSGEVRILELVKKDIKN
jgi:hypothetical protein